MANATLASLQEERERMLAAARTLQNEIEAARSFASAQEGFDGEATEQKHRLTAIRLYRGEPGGNNCPLCEHVVS